MDMIDEKAEPDSENPTTMFSPNSTRKLRIPFPIQNNNEGPVDKKFAQNKQNCQNDKIDRQKTEAKIKRTRNRNN